MAKASRRQAGRSRRLVTGLRWLPLLVAVVDWVALRSGRLSHPPAWLALFVGVAILAQFVALLALLWNAAHRRVPPVRALAEAAIALGLVMALAAGTANWLLGLTGFVILHEGEAVPLHGGSHLQHFENGPLSRIEEMELVLALEELTLVPAGGGEFYPRSQLRVERRGEPPLQVRIDREAAAASGTLRFLQGAFGFAPRIVIDHDGETVFDRVVPFTSERHGATGLSFAGEFLFERERLEIDGRIDLSSLDEAMRGHATLVVAVRRDGELLGHGRLQPGHFAKIERGYRIGFAGLERWSEIDLSRRSYASVLLAGAGLGVAGALLWPLACWRRW